MPRTYLRLVIYACCFLAALPPAQNVVVWKFAPRGEVKSDIVVSLTDEFEEALLNRGGFIILERRNLERLKVVLRRERALHDVTEISQENIRKLKLLGASMVVFGEVFDDVDSGDVKVGVSFQTFEGQTVLKGSVLMKRGRMGDAESRKAAMRDLVNSLSWPRDADNVSTAAIPKTVQLEVNILGEYLHKTAIELHKNTEDPELAEALKLLDDAIDVAQKDLQRFKSRDQEHVLPERQEYYVKLAERISEAQKLLEEQISASYKSYRVEYRSLNNAVMQPQSREFLIQHLDELKAACAGSRKIIVMGFGCARGSLAATERISWVRAADVGSFLRKEALCAGDKIRTEGFGIDIRAEDLAGIDLVEVERILERSRYVKLLIPRQN